jgi:hypothetical protein
MAVRAGAWGPGTATSAAATGGLRPVYGSRSRTRAAGAQHSAGVQAGGQLAWPQGSVWVLDVDGGQVQHSGYPSPLRLRDPQAGYYYYQIAPRSVAFQVDRQVDLEHGALAGGAVDRHGPAKRLDAVAEPHQPPAA